MFQQVWTDGRDNKRRHVGFVTKTMWKKVKDVHIKFRKMNEDYIGTASCKNPKRYNAWMEILGNAQLYTDVSTGKRLRLKNERQPVNIRQCFDDVLSIY